MGLDFPEVSVIVLTYRSGDSVALTLDSVVRQEGVRMQVVIADDGSEDDSFEIASQFMKKYPSIECVLIKNEVNLGTVKNFYSALAKARYLYIKPLGAGDMLIDKDVLARLYSTASSAGADLVVSQPACFHLNENSEMVYGNATIPGPVYISKYYSKNNWIFPIINLDAFFSGSTFFLKQELFWTYEKYFKEVRYAEDLLQVAAAVHGRTLVVEPTFTILYESALGVSTSGRFQKLLLNDKVQFYKNIVSMWGEMLPGPLVRLLNSKIAYLEEKTLWNVIIYLFNNPWGFLNKFLVSRRRTLPPERLLEIKPRTLGQWINALPGPPAPTLK